MEVHPREKLVQEAEHKISSAILDAVEHLTQLEQLQVVNKVASEYIASLAKYGIRYERHGNGDTPGGLVG